MNVVGVYEKHFFVVVFYVLKELNRHNKKDSALIKSVTNVPFGHNCCSLMVLDPLCPIPIKKRNKISEYLMFISCAKICQYV